jgi:hypothetical protein
MSIQTLEEADRAKKALQRDIHSYFKEVRTEEMLTPTKEEKRQWAFNTIDFGNIKKVEDITDDMVMECCQCHRKFLLENMKWAISSSPSSKYPYEPLCINYPHGCSYKLGVRYKGFRKQEEVTQCPKHSKYKAFKAPTNGCQICIKMYAYIKCISLEEAQKRAGEQTQSKQTKKAVEVCWYCKNKRGHNCHVCHGNHS